MKYAKDMEVVFIDGLLHTSDASALGIVDELELQLVKISSLLTVILLFYCFGYCLFRDS